MTDVNDDQSRKAKVPPYFDFVIAERPVYIRNSGPPSQPISVMPPHDKEMLIEAEIQLGQNGLWFYQVYHPRQPGLRVSVKPQNILDWVSSRTLEEWELEGPERRQREQEEFLREQEVELRAMKLKPSTTKSRAADGFPTTLQRKRKTAEIENEFKRRLSSNPAVPAALAGPARKRKSIVEDEPVFTSPTTTHKRPKGPSLTTPVKNLDPETDTADDGDLDDEDDYEVIQRQLYHTSPRRYGPFTAPIHPLGYSHASTPKRATSTPKRAPSIPAPPKSPLFSPIPVSSVEFRKGYEKLEREKEKQVRRPSAGQSIKEKYSGFSKRSMFQSTSSSMFKASPERAAALKHIRSPFAKKTIEENDQGEEISSDEPVIERTPRPHKPAVAVAEKQLRPKKPAFEEEIEQELSGTEWEIDEILEAKDDYIDDQGVARLHYLIKWTAPPGMEFDDTWEPAENITEGAIGEFKLKEQCFQTPLLASPDVRAHPGEPPTPGEARRGEAH